MKVVWKNQHSIAVCSRLRRSLKVLSWEEKVHTPVYCTTFFLSKQLCDAVQQALLDDYTIALRFACLISCPDASAALPSRMNCCSRGANTPSMLLRLSCTLLSGSHSLNTCTSHMQTQHCTACAAMTLWYSRTCYTRCDMKLCRLVGQ